MQEEVNEKTISLCIKGGKITAQILKAALIKLLAEMDKKKQQRKGEKSQSCPTSMTSWNRRTKPPMASLRLSETIYTAFGRSSHA